MLPPIPFLDLDGFKRRTKFVRTDVDLFVANNPGYLEHGIARASSLINARLHKRYATPLGQSPPTLVATGTTQPVPPVSLIGRPTVGSLEIVIKPTTPGAVGVAVFQWSKDGGLTWTTGVATAATVQLGGTGLSAIFPAGTYATDHSFSASTPVPEIALGWLVAFVDIAVWDRRGRNAQDPTCASALERYTEAKDELKEAADSKEGLFELPTNDQAGDTPVIRAGPLAYSETSPYVSADMQAMQGREEDLSGSGTTW